MASEQQNPIYPRPQQLYPPTRCGGQLVTIGTDHPGLGGQINALYFPGPSPSAPVIVFFHGNGDQLGEGPAKIAPAFVRRGAGFFAVEYPGYGVSPGEPSEEALYATAEVGLVHLTSNLGVSPQQIVLAGQSLGAAVAMEMAIRGRGARVVFISPFTSVADMGSLWFPKRVVDAFLLATKDRYDNMSKAPHVKIPSDVIHGLRDVLAPPWMGQALAAALPTCFGATMVNADHYDVFDVVGTFETILGPQQPGRVLVCPMAQTLSSCVAIYGGLCGIANPGVRVLWKWTSTVSHVWFQYWSASMGPRPVQAGMMMPCNPGFYTSGTPSVVCLVH